MTQEPQQPPTTYEWVASSEVLVDRAAVAAGPPRRSIEVQAPGAALGPFKIVGTLGRGGMGVVYRARDQRTDREVALKQVLTTDPTSLERLWREAQTAASLQHSGIVAIHEIGEAEGAGPYLVYELVPDARPLDVAWVDLDLRGRVALLRDAAEALGYAHVASVTHRDVKPENILVDSEGRVRVTDFGLAQVVGLERLTQSGALVGTPSYMAPEQIAPSPEAPIGSATDVWALGVLLYLALTDELPFQASDLLRLATQIVGGSLTAPRRARPGVPPDLEALCLSALKVDPSARPQTGHAFAAALTAFLEGRAAPGMASGAKVGVGLGGGLLLLALAAIPLSRGGASSGATSAGSAPTGPASPSPVATASPSSWFDALPPGQRPRRLPPGLRIGDARGEYINERDASVLVWVPAGSFTMGDEDGQADERPLHTVVISRGFFLGKHETTWAQFDAFCAATKRTPPLRTIGTWTAGPQHPVFNVTWVDARAYCSWAGLRLPTEAEWEYAARGGTGRSYPWGKAVPVDCPTPPANLADERLAAVAGETYRIISGYDDGHAYPSRVGAFPAGVSRFGAHDMCGNVWEWVYDLYGPYSAAKQRDPRGPARADPAQRVARGGSAQEREWGSRSANRISYAPDFDHVGLGFRVCRD